MKRCNTSYVFREKHARSHLPSKSVHCLQCCACSAAMFFHKDTHFTHSHEVTRYTNPIHTPQAHFNFTKPFTHASYA